MEAWKNYHEKLLTLSDLSSLKEKLLEELDELTSRPVEHKKVKNLRDRVIKYREDIFTYLDNPKVEPSNNIAERLLKVAARLKGYNLRESF